MEVLVLGFCLSLLVSNYVIQANEISVTEATEVNLNETLLEYLRQPRVSGRIVKLYSGTRPEPIHCSDEGFQPDSADCAVFYRCVKTSTGKYTVFRFQCGPGTIYDPDTEVCNHPQSTKRSECGSRVVLSTVHSKENEIDGKQELPSPISTKKHVYTEQTTTQKHTSTAYPWVSSSKRQSSETPSSSLVTAYPWETSIKRSEAPTSPKSTAYPWASDSQQNSWYTRATPSVTHHSNSQGVDICTSDGFIGDSENCRKFYRCVGNQQGGFIKYEFSCSESTVWDDDSQSCNHQWAVQRRRCGRGEIQINKALSSSNQKYNDQLPSEITMHQQSQNNYGEKVFQTQTQISHLPAIQNQTQINYSDRLNKGTSTAKPNQTQISHGSAVSQTQTQINHGNKDVQTKIQIDHSNKSSQIQTQVYDSSTRSTTTKVVQDDEAHQGYDNTQGNTASSNNNGDNSNECTESGFMGDKKNCKKFYRCVDNGKGSYIKYEFSCGEGTVWDPNIEACNHVWAVKECGGKTPTETSTATQVVPTTMTNSTQNYYPTSESTTTEVEDLPSYGNQNQDRPTTSKPTTVQEKPTSTQPTNNAETACSSSGFFGDENDCKKFYRCVDNGRGSYTKYKYKCGEGTLWDPDIETCNHVWAVKKCGGSSTDVNKEETTTKGKTTVMTTVSLIQTTSQTPTQNIDYYDSGYGNQNQQSESPPLTTTTQQPQNKPTGSGNECESSGFMGDKNDCKKFYRCVDAGNGAYIRYEFNCGEGTVWDPKIEACNHAWAVEKCGEDYSADIHKETTIRPHPSMNDEEGTSVGLTTEKEVLGYDQSNQSTEKTTTTTSQSQLPQSNDDICTQDGFTGDGTDCKKFYRCVSNQRGGFIKYEFNCGEGTVWDSEINACNHPRDVKSPCNAGTFIQSESPIESSQESTTKYTTQITSSDTASSQSSVPPSSTKKPLSDKQCSQTGFVGDDQDCKKFYRCVDNGKGGFIKYEFSCGEGTVWDPEIEACNHPPPDKHCGGSGYEPTSTTKEPDHENDEMYADTTSSSISSSTEKSSSTSTTWSNQKPQTSGDNSCKSEGFHGDPNDCRKFYRCVDNGKGSYTKYDFTCGDGTVWDQEIKTCNHVTDSMDCTETSDNGSTQSTQAEMTEVYSNTTSGSTNTELQQSTQATQAPPDGSSSKCKSEGFYANPGDCRKFYRCVNNGNGGYTKYDFSCGDGTVWVQDIQACDHDSDTESCSKQSGSSTNEQGPGGLQTSSESSTISSGTTSQPNKDNDEYPSEASTKPSSSSEGKCNSEGFYANDNDCKRFYRCVDNGNGGYTKYDFACGEGTAWDSNVQSCNHISEVQDCQGSYQDSQPKPMHDEVAQPTGDGTSGTEKTSTLGPHSENQSQSSNKDICVQEGYFGNTQDCKKFYRCVDNGKGGFTKYDFTCGEGTIWDQDVTTCNHPQDVTNPSCQKIDSSYSSSTSSTSSSESSTTTSPYPSSSTQSSSTGSSGQGGSSNCSQEDSSKKPAKKDVNCTEAGYFADPNDCKKFYRCVDWDGDGKRFSVYHFDCGEGTIWDPALDTCNHEDSVYPPRDCSGAQSQNENMKPESSTTDDSTTTGQETTTEKSTTSEETTAKEPTTSEETTTQQATTSEKTTTQQTTTSEQTTQQTTSEQTTTQHTTSEQTTTQQTTAQQTTTPQTTSELTTEQQTTAQQTTTQETSTEQTTTKQTTLSEQSTEQQTTSTTQQSTTVPQTTAQQTTTEQTTTQESTTSEQSTTQQITELTTSKAQDPTTTEQTPTDDNSDQQSTTKQPTDQTTPQESTTEQQTTEQSNEATEDSTSTTSQTADSSTTAGEDNTTTESGQETTESSSSGGDCPKTEDDQNLFVCPTSFRRHPKYCNLFYQCTEDDDNHDIKIATFNCPNNTIYDETQTKCVEEDKADKKCDGEIAQRRRVKRLDATYKEPIEVTQERLKCPSVGHFPFEKEECSSAFLKCQQTKSGKIRGYVYQCPEGFMYWSISRRCEAKLSVHDCKHSYNSWNGRWEIPIERRNVAP